MADVVSYELTDSEGLIGTVPLYIASGNTVADVTAWAQAMALDIGVVTGAEVTGIRWTSSIEIPGGMEAAHPIAGDLRETGVVLLMETGEQANFGVHIPAIQLDKLQGKTVIVDADIQALVSQLTTAVNGITAQDRSGNVLLSLVKATKSVRRKS